MSLRPARERSSLDAGLNADGFLNGSGRSALTVVPSVTGTKGFLTLSISTLSVPGGQKESGS